MADIVFTIPASRDELLNEVNSTYSVRNVIIPVEIVPKLEEAGVALRDNGSTFILENFDTYYSVLHHANTLRTDVIHKAYYQLNTAVKNLYNLIILCLDDQGNLNHDDKAKMVNVLKMLIYVYVQFILYFEEKKKSTEGDLAGKGKNREKSGSNFTIDKSQALRALNNVIQTEINLFWEPPIVEHDFISLIAEFCFNLLQNPTIKQEKNVVVDIFGVFGNLVKSYDYGKSFVSRLIQSIRLYEHVVHCVMDGIQMMVQQFNCQSLIHHFVIEATEWQVDESYQDVQGTRCCALFLTELTEAMPDLILPEVVYLNKYLAHDSIPLRVAVLNILSEIVLKVLTKHDLSEDEKESRDEFMDIIIEHIRDVSAAVRAKVIQNLSKLQKESAVPLVFQNEVLTEIVKHLFDKAAAVRKVAIASVTTFLEHNPFGANLQLEKVQETLQQKREMLQQLESTYKETQLAKIQQLETDWSEIEPELTEEIQKQLQEDEDEEEDEEETENQENLVETVEVVDQMRNLLKDKKYAEGFRKCRRFKNSIEECRNMRRVTGDMEVKMYVEILHSIFIDTVKIVDELRTGAGMTPEDIEKIRSLENIINYFQDTAEFLKIIDSVIEPMKSLLFSQTMSDTNEAINFFITAYQFQIDNANQGILEMLKMMRCTEQDRKAAVVEAFKTIYLTTDTKKMAEHTTTILNRLIALLRDLTYDSLDDFQNIVTEWTVKGILDNSVIGRCWEYYTQHDPVSDDDARAAADLLRMAAMGRPTIATKNIALVTTIAFSERHKNDMMFLAKSFRLLAVMSLEKIDVQSETPPFRIKHTDAMFQVTTNILLENFFQKVPFYSDAMQSGLDFIFRVCSKPLDVAENFIKQVDVRLQESPKHTYLIIRFCELLGCLSIKLLGYLDNNVYRELKRRNYLRDERKKETRTNKHKKRAGKSSSNASNVSDSVNESMVGAEAEDADAEFILGVLENDIVSMKGCLGQYSGFIISICQRPDVYNDVLLQQSAVTALMRYMLVSGKFCQSNIRLLFTILEKTTHPQIKCTILVHCSDMLTRFPNIVEPWSPRIYGLLRDQLVEVRKKAFFALANLILRDMIRAQSHISEMAACLIDPNREISEMSRNFFERVSQKQNNLVNLIPDIFTNLVRMEDIDEESLRFILKFLFDLVDNSKQIENLVDRFCCKYTPDENLRLNRNITYCLSLINYNEKALKKLREKFPMYQHHVHDAEIYSTFKQILAECAKTKVGKADLKPIVTEIENCIASVFELNEDGPQRPPPISKSTKKAKNKPRKRTARKQVSDSEDDSDEGVVAKTKRSNRGRPRKSSSSN